LIFGSVLIVVLAGYGIARAWRWLARQWFLRVLWQFLSGWHHDGRPGRPRRAGIRCGAAAGAVALVACWSAAPVLTGRFVISVVLLTFCAGLLWLWRTLRRFRHHRTWLRPLHLAAHEVAQVDRRRAPHQWLEVAPDRSAAVLALPSGWPADGTDKQRLVAIASAKLGMEAPEVSWRLAGPKPQLALTAAQPPPREVALAGVRRSIEQARADEVVWGLGKRGAVVKSSLSGDSPHAGLSMGSGAGKSVTARGFLAQMLYRGAIGLILDYKMISHQWAQGLPNVAIARRPHEIHRALLWLGGEVERRNEVALAGADMDGNVHAVVGPRLIVICEELNATVARLRAYWRAERAGDRDLPQRSPALEALDSASFMGRQVLTNILYIGQRLSVKASGGDGDARENIGVIAFGRYSASNWKMLAGDYPMPPKSMAPGRIQVVTDRVRECQAVFMSAREARALAVAGEVGIPPAGMPFVWPVPTETASQISGSDLGGLKDNGLAVLAPPARVTLSEAVNLGIVLCSLHAVRKASQRDHDFPGGVGVRGLAKIYDAAELAGWDAGRR
jgi:hypothetical protein